MARRAAIVVAASCLFVIPALGQEAGLPGGWTSFTLSACEDAGQFAAAAGQQYARYELVAQEGARKVGRALRWRFQTRQAGVAELRAAFPLRREFDALTLWLKNPFDHDLLLAARFVEADGSEFLTAAVPLRGQKGWRQLRFVLADCRLEAGSSDENEGLDFPLASLVILAQNAVAGQAYELYLDEIEGQQAPPGVVRVESFSAPPSAARGQALDVELALSSPQGNLPTDRLELGLSAGGVQVAEVALALPKPASAWEPGEVVQARAEGLRAPAWAGGGLYDLRLSGRGVRVQNAAHGEGVLARVRLEGAEPGQTEATVGQRGGVPTLVVNGKPHSGLGYVATGVSPEVMREMAAAGVHLVAVPATSDYDPYGLAGDVWLDEGTFDYSDLDRRVSAILTADREAHPLLRVYICSPPWWDRRHLNECVLFATGHHAADATPRGRKNTYPSWSSALWRRDAGEALRRLVRHVEQSPYGHRVIGYQLASGATGSWDFWGVYDGHFGDYSPPEKAAFQRWLRTKYGNSRSAFLEAWGPEPGRAADAGGDSSHFTAEHGRRFTTATIPTKAARLKQGPRPSPHSAVLDPAYDQPLIDYHLFSADRTAETIDQFAQIAKEASGGRKLVGAAYGHILRHAAYPDGLQNGGHLALGKLLRSPSVDFLAGRGARFASASARAHGKLWFEEDALFVGRRAPEADAGALGHQAFARALACGAGMSWLAPGGWADDAQMQASVARMARVAEAFLERDRRSAAQVALVLDERSLCYTKADNGLVGPMLAQQATELARLGAPFDVCLLPDVVEGRVPPYRLYVFAGTLVLDEAQRLALHRILSAGRRTAVWVYAPGCLDELQLPKQVKQLTGVRVTLDSKPAPLRVKIADMADPYTEGVGGLEYGTQKPVAPVYYIIDDEAQELGELLSNHRPGLCVTEGPEGFVSIYSVAPALPARLLRNIARQAGVHLYHDGDAEVYAGREVLALWRRQPGEAELRFAVETSVYDVMAREQLALGVRQVPVNLGPASVGLYFLGEGADFWGR
ncbi:MAG: hypothetical protein ACE5R4_05920 [Armatimonadota bacterium]